MTDAAQKTLSGWVVTLALGLVLGAAGCAGPTRGDGGSPGGSAAAPGCAAPAPSSVEVAASAADGFHHPYLLVVPEGVRAGAPIVVSMPTPAPSQSAENFMVAARWHRDGEVELAAELGCPVLVPVVPRPSLRGEPDNLYVSAMSRAALVVGEERYRRFDLQLIAMIDDARERLGVGSPEGVLLSGFSAGGDFVTRFAVLHPERCLGVWAGGTGGLPILPVGELDGEELRFPLGVADLEEVTGAAFDEEAFRGVPMMIVQGGADENDSVPFRDSYSEAEEAYVFGRFGALPMDRFGAVERVYRRFGARVEFRTYAGVGHEVTAEMWGDRGSFFAWVVEEE